MMVYVVADPDTGTSRAAQLLVVYPALRKLSCRVVLRSFCDRAFMVQKADKY
jgi:hypothetical protein